MSRSPSDGRIGAPEFRRGRVAETCARCVLSTDVPETTIDEDGVCSVCREYERRRTTYEAYFRDERDFRQLVERSRVADVPDCLLLYSGGKDSTYVLYRLVDLGCRVLTVTFDNGYIPRACFENIERVCESVGVDNVVVRVAKDRMDRVFVESLRVDNTVCSGCFRALTARSTELAIERRIPIVVTGLSRGQLFATKVHRLMQSGITEPDRIDACLHEFRRFYHASGDATAGLVDDRVLEHEEAFDGIAFVDFYRYTSVTKADIVRLLDQRAPFWQKPQNVGGCSTNCLINDAGIHVHLETRGYHNYAIPLAWDVRFGHLSREEAGRQLWGAHDGDKVIRLLRTIGYEQE